jgi:hypothetical protein
LPAIARNLPDRSGDASGFRTACVVFFADREQALSSLHTFSIGETYRSHRVRLHAIEDVEEIVGVAAHQRDG